MRKIRTDFCSLIMLAIVIGSGLNITAKANVIDEALRDTAGYVFDTIPNPQFGSVGGEMGFFAGAISGFVSNFFFAQGPFTPWQMFAFGLVGFVAGALFETGFLKKQEAR